MTMDHCLVTGAAGFVGSHLCEQLLAQGHRVTGVDAFIPYYPRSIKEANLHPWRNTPNFRFYEHDLRQPLPDSAWEGVQVVFHLAAMAGLALSWQDFDLYMTCNLQATQRLLEGALAHQVRHFIYASTSSVYGRHATGDENQPLKPISPYGITKLAAENLCRAYADNFGLPLTILRYFSIYGPRQRPDMAYHIFIRALLTGEPITVYGDGEQSRSNTFVADCVRGTLLAFDKRERAMGEVMNVGGGEIVSLNQVLDMLQEMTGQTARIISAPPKPGDQRHTAADITKAHRILGYAPQTRVAQGLAAQLTWQHKQLQAGPDLSDSLSTRS